MRTVNHNADGRFVEVPRITPKDIAGLGGFSYHGIIRAIHRGELKAYKLCGQWRMFAQDIEAWIESCLHGEPDTRSEVQPDQRLVAPARGSLAALRQLEDDGRRQPAA